MQELYTSSNTNNGTKASLLYLNANNDTTNANANISSRLLSVDSIQNSTFKVITCSTLPLGKK